MIIAITLAFADRCAVLRASNGREDSDRTYHRFSSCVHRITFLRSSHGNDAFAEDGQHTILRREDTFRIERIRYFQSGRSDSRRDSSVGENRRLRLPRDRLRQFATGTAYVNGSGRNTIGKGDRAIIALTLFRGEIEIERIVSNLTKRTAGSSRCRTVG